MPRDRTTEELRAPDGRLLATYDRGERDGRPIADLLVPADGVGTDELREACLRDRSGWIVVGPEALGLALVEAGATKRRHAHLYSHDLQTVPPRGEDDRIVAFAAPAERLEAIQLRAYRPEHPDYEHSSQPGNLDGLLDGSLLGPLLPCSRMAVVDGEIVGAILVSDMAGEPPVAGPWLSELFRDPAHRGVGRALVRAMLAEAAADGLPAIGLVVSEGNPARGLYEDEGFAHVRSDLSVYVP